MKKTAMILGMTLISSFALADKRNVTCEMSVETGPHETEFFQIPMDVNTDVSASLERASSVLKEASMKMSYDKKANTFSVAILRSAAKPTGEDSSDDSADRLQFIIGGAQLNWNYIKSLETGAHIVNVSPLSGIGLTGIKPFVQCKVTGDNKKDDSKEKEEQFGI